MTARPVPTRPLGRTVRWAVAAVAVLAVGPTGPAAPSHRSRSEQATGAVACLGQRLRPSDRCPPVEIDVAVDADGKDLVLRVTNMSGRAWAGGPLAVELPVPGAEVDEPEGRVDRSGRPGTPEWTTRVGTVVSRCVFEPVTTLRAGDDLTCRLRRLGLHDGLHQLWFTGFVGGLPEVRGPLGDDAPAPGVVAAATTRSLRIRTDGDQATVVAPGGEATGAGADEAPRGGEQGRSLAPIVIGGVLVVAGLGVVAWTRRRSR